MLAGAVIALLSAVGALAAVAPDARNAPSEQDFLNRVNAARAAAGIAALPSSDDLVAVARHHSQDMASQHQLYHDTNLGSEVTGWQTLGENVGDGADVASVHDAFMRSQVHRDAILSPSFTDIGIGVVWDGSTLWVTEVFRQVSGSSVSPAPQPAPAPSPTTTAPPQPSPQPARTLAAAPPAAPPTTPPRASRSAPVPAAAPAPAPVPTTAEPAPSTRTDVAVAALASAGDAAAPATQLALGDAHVSRPLSLPADLPRIPAPVGVAAALLALTVAAQGVVVRRLGLA